MSISLNLFCFYVHFLCAKEGERAAQYIFKNCIFYLKYIINFFKE
jgi:hypothetical protein